MKRMITFCVIIMGIVLCVAGIVKANATESTLDISSGLDVLAHQSSMAKSAMGKDKITFSADDFEKWLNLSSGNLVSITIKDLPSVNEGCLCLGDTLVNEGQSISRANLDILNYRLANSTAKESAFTFCVNGGEYELKCNLYFLNRENEAPTLSLEDERIFNVSTHQSVMVYGKLSAYDVDGDDLKYEITSYAKNGTLELNSKTGEYNYNPIGTYFGEDSFCYVAIDKYGNYSGEGRVNLNVEKLKSDVVFYDMQNHPAHHYALTMVEKGIMSGIDIGNTTYFMPDKSVSRLDFVVMVMNSIGVRNVENVFDTGFDDDDQIPQSFKGYVREARARGIISGAVNANGDYYFEPNREITRAEAAIIVNNIVKGNVPTVKPSFADKDEIPVWASDAIYTLNSMGILSSIDSEIAANASITRAQTAQMLYALMDEIK